MDHNDIDITDPNNLKPLYTFLRGTNHYTGEINIKMLVDSVAIAVVDLHLPNISKQTIELPTFAEYLQNVIIDHAYSNDEEFLVRRANDGSGYSVEYQGLKFTDKHNCVAMVKFANYYASQVNEE